MAIILEFEMIVFRSIATAMVVAALSTPANANVVYNLTFSGGDTGQLVLNFASVAAAESISYTSIVPYFVSLSANNLAGQNFLINSSNLADGYISTGTMAQLYTLTVEETQPNNVPAGTSFLDVYTNSWQVHETPWNDTLNSNSLTIGSPSFVANAQEPSTLTVMISGFCGLGFLAYRKQRGLRRAACP